MSPAIQREFLTHTVVGLKKDTAEVEKKAKKLEEKIREISRKKLEIAKKVVEFGNKDTCFIIGGGCTAGNDAR